MGNQLVGLSPSQIFPAEHYLAERTEYKFDVSLGSTRFFKVARAECPEGLIVVKIFAIHDPTLPLQPYKECIENIRLKLTSASNCVSFQSELAEKAGFLVREYVKYSLYDRISTRPFMTNTEKRWVTFQILCALNQCHKVGVCHGDIKLENITVTSWNWVLLLDFASFKPTFLPEDNPSDYNYFFDTSRRRVCYIAPERFKRTHAHDSDTLFNENICGSGDLTPSMDIFSAGCALIELWNEGHAPFEYSQLLAYRNNEYSPQKHLDKIVDPNLREMLASMIQIDPLKRLSAETYLSQERGRLFPEYFYTFLQPYMLIFSSTPILSADEKIMRIKSDISSIIDLFVSEPGGPDEKPTNEKSISNELPMATDAVLYKQDENLTTDESKTVQSTVETKEPGSADKTTAGDNVGKQVEENEVTVRDGLVLMVTLVTSCIRNLHDCSSKLEVLEILEVLAKHANEETILERILPYLMCLINDSNHRIRAATIGTLTTCLGYIKKVPRSDANVFPDYIFPGIAHLSSDKSVGVRIEFAKNIARLAELSVQFLEQTQTDSYDRNRKNIPKINYETELQVLHALVKQTVSNLLSDPSSLVKRAILESDIIKLCVFFGKDQSNDIILSHVITFLNDKDDKDLRMSFFECIVAIATYLGFHVTVLLIPLLVQGLTDSEEYVICKAIKAMDSITELGLFQNKELYDLLAESMPYLMHPSLWIRQAMVSFLVTSIKAVTLLVANVRIIPSVLKFQKDVLVDINKPYNLLESLKEAIPRMAFENVLKYNQLDELLNIFFKRLQFRIAFQQGKADKMGNIEMSVNTKNMLIRLGEYGLKFDQEKYLLMMRNLLLKLRKARLSAESKPAPDGKIEIDPLCVRTFTFTSDLRTIQKPHISLDGLGRQNDAGTTLTRQASSRPSSPTSEIHSSFATADPSSNYSVHERSYIQYRTSSCNAELRRLLARQQDKYLEAVRSREWAEQAAWESPIPPPGWRLKGSLVAHLHEHKTPVNRLLQIPDTPLFASGSADGAIRLWDCSKIEGKNIANRSRDCYNFPESTYISAMAACEGGLFAAAGYDGTIAVFKVDNASSRINFIQKRHMGNDGRASDIQYLNSGPHSVLVYSTTFGALVGWDLRSPDEAWRLDNGMRRGVINSFCINSHQSWCSIGTSSGYHITWDLRFQLPVQTMEHPAGPIINKVVCHPKKDSWIIASYALNNEISMWNLETGAREKVLWSSDVPPLTKQSVMTDTTRAMYAGLIDLNGFLITGCDDERIRFFDLEDFSNSRIAVFGGHDNLMGGTVHYSERLIDGTPVVVETISPQPEDKKNSGKADETPRAGPEPPPVGHHNVISDIILCKANQCFMVTSSRDGVIKVWK